MMATSRRGFMKGVCAAGAVGAAAELCAPKAAVAQDRGSRYLKISEINPEHYKVRQESHSMAE
jgi:hypothetical protein